MSDFDHAPPASGSPAAPAVVTLTPNPSLDRTVEVPALVRGAVNRAVDGRVDPGGKGVNVSRALGRHGVATVAVLPVGGPDGDQLVRLLRERGVRTEAVPVAGCTRSNVTVVEPDGTTTKLNEAGPTLDAAETARLLKTLAALAPAGSWVVGCGSLPAGVPGTLYADLVAPLRAQGVRVAVDSSGPALAAVLAAGPGALPDLVKPNHEELEEAVGRPLPTLGDVVTAAHDLVARGITTVLVSLGADGAVLVEAGTAVHGSARLERPNSTVGAGDALLAGYLSRAAAGAADPVDRLSAALAWGTAAAGLPGSAMPGPENVAAVAVTIHDPLDAGLPLEGDHR